MVNVLNDSPTTHKSEKVILNSIISDWVLNLLERQAAIVIAITIAAAIHIPILP